MSAFDTLTQAAEQGYQAGTATVSGLADSASVAAGQAQPKCPAFKLTLAGKDITQRLESRLMSLTLTDNRGFESDQLDIILDDADGKLDLPNRGVTIQVALGWQGTPLVDKGSFIIDEIEHEGAPDILTLRGRATDLRAGITTKREKSWHRTTLGAIVGAIAKANGLTVAIPAWVAKQKIEHIDQTNESDANLLSRLAHQHDLVATVKQGRLIVCKAGDAESVSGKAFPTVVLTRTSGDRHRFAIADRDAFTAVKAQWFDVSRAKKGEAVVDANTRFERRATVTKLGKKSKRTKLTAIQQKGIEASADSIKVLRHVYASQATALQGAKAAWQKIQRGAAEFSLTLAEGRPELFPELPVTVKGYKPAIDGSDWVLTKVTHNLADGGYTTALELEMKLTEG